MGYVRRIIGRQLIVSFSFQVNMYTADSDCKGGGIWNEYSQTSSLFSLLSLFFILGYCFYSMFLYCHTQLPHFQLIIILFPFLVYWGLSFENLGFGKGKRENGSWYSDVNNTILHKDDNLIHLFLLLIRTVLVVVLVLINSMLQ